MPTGPITEENSEDEDGFEDMRKRVLKKVNRRAIDRKCKRLILFQKELIEQFDTI